MWIQIINWIEINIQIVNTLVLLLTAGIVACYTRETYKLRREMVRQNEINLRPYLVPSFPETPDGYKFELKNIGPGTATNIQIEPFTMQFTDVAAQSRYQYSTIAWLESGAIADVKVWCNKQASKMNTLLVPQANRFQVSDANGTRQAGSRWTLRVLLDDVEGGRYLQEFDIEPSERPEPSNVVARAVCRMPPDFKFKHITQ